VIGQQLGRLWRCAWLGHDLISIDLFSPPQAVAKSLAEGVAVEIVRRALVRCVDGPDKPDQHACFVEAASLALALARARELHPTWRPS